jgi:hypothetical protein
MDEGLTRNGRRYSSCGGIELIEKYGLADGKAQRAVSESSDT